VVVVPSLGRGDTVCVPALVCLSHIGTPPATRTTPWLH
jgi:hypothetical protein